MVHFFVIAETKLREKTYHRPTHLRWGGCAPSRDPETPRRRGGAGRKPLEPHSAPHCGVDLGRGGERAAVRAQTQTRRRPFVPAPGRREAASMSLGAAPLGECSGVGVQDSDVGSLRTHLGGGSLDVGSALNMSSDAALRSTLGSCRRSAGTTFWSQTGS